MICVFDKNAKDFTTNGLAPLAPIKCEVTETLNGEYRLEMKHPYDDFGKWQYLQPGNIIKVSVPKMNVPLVSLITKKEAASGEESASKTYAYVYRCAVERAEMRSCTSMTEGELIDSIYYNEKLLLPYNHFIWDGDADAEGSIRWAQAVSPRGLSGFVRIDLDFVHVRELQIIETGGDSVTEKEEIREVVPQTKIRDQPFRIYRVVHSLKEITVYAKHIFYDLQDNVILKYEPGADLAGKEVAAGILSSTVSPHSFTLYSDITETASDAVFEKMNPADALLNETDGFCAKYHAEILRDWYDVYLVSRIGEETNITIADGKNLKSLTCDEDITDMANRIIPVGTDSEGNPLYLPETYIQSPNMQESDIPKYITLDVSEAAVGDELTQEEAYTKMREAANAEFDLGADSPVETVTVDYIDMTDADEYKSIWLKDNIFLGDLVHVRARRLKKDFIKRMTQYKYDCLTQRYTKITLGTPYDIN